jgi:phospholipid/cholesterol/gamma-HCH transport system permease protein
LTQALSRSSGQRAADLPVIIAVVFRSAKGHVSNHRARGFSSLRVEHQTVGQQAMQSHPAPAVSIVTGPAGDTLRMTGDWTMRHGRSVEALMQQASATRQPLTMDFSAVTAFDTLGALALSRLRSEREAAGAKIAFAGMSPSHEILLAEANTHPIVQKPQKSATGVDILVDIGRGMTGISRDFTGGISFLGSFVAALGRMIVQPSRFRWPAIVKQIEMFGFRSVPIIALISFLVGGIIAQQSVFQLSTFGTTAFVADLLGILILRELGVLLTSIMIAGRSGSAITAEIGSMKMREEIDALRTMGLDPMEVLIVPRILALIICLPLLTFIASMAGLFGGGLVAWVYGDVSPDVFLTRLQNAIRFNTFMVGMIKAPVMALVIGLIASIEGMAVKGSAESLGRQTTASVVKAIFMVIVVDGLFAMFFASIRY